MDRDELQILAEAFTVSRKEDMDRVLRTLTRELDLRFEGVTKIVDDLCPRVDRLEANVSKVRGFMFAIAGLAGLGGLIAGLRLIGIIH